MQCKRKDVLLHTLLTEKEVVTEVENAKAFKPPLVALTIVTCTASDAKVQELARQITAEHAAKALFRLDVLSWSEITSRLTEHGLLSQVFGFQPVDPAAAEMARSAQARDTKLLAGQIAIQQQIADLASKLVPPAQDGPAHATLDACRALLEMHSYRAALTLLERARKEEWERADPKLRFRIATNLGAAHIGLGANELGGRFFLDAYEYDNISEKALANRALGLLLTNRSADAAAAAREALVKHSHSGVVWTAFVNVIGRVEPETPLPEPPPDLADDPTLLLVRADMLGMRKAWAAAEVLLRKLLTLPHADPIARSRLAEVLMSRGNEEGCFYGGASYPSEQLARFYEARDLLRQSWAAVKDTELASGSVYIVQNACALATVLGEMESVEDLLEEALRVAPDDSHLLTWEVRMCSMRGDGTGALRAFARISPDADDYELLEATASRAANDPTRAAKVLEQWIRANPSPTESIDARCIFADSVCEGDNEHAEARFSSLPHAGEPAVARSTAIFARALRNSGQGSAAAPYLTVVRQQLGSSSRDRLLLADTLTDFNEYAAAVTIYEKEVSAELDTPALREYIRCLFALDQRRRLADLMSKLPESVARKPAYEFYRANLALRIGDFPSARAALERCLATGQEKLSTRILWADVCLRLEDRDAADAWLRTVDAESPELTVDQFLRLGPMLHHLNRSEAATRFFYSALRRFPQDPRTHLAFTASVMFKGSQAWLAVPPIAAADTAVALQDEDGRERTYLLENRPEATLEGDELSTSSSLGARLVGRSVGDVIQGHSSTLATHQSKIVSVQHKFMHAAHESMNAFNTRFPEAPGLVGVKLPTSGTPDEQLAPILRALTEKSSRRSRLKVCIHAGCPLRPWA